MRALRSGLVLVACVALPALATAQSSGLIPIPDYGGDFESRTHMSGDWGGERTDLAERGITFDFTWNQVSQAVLEGGRNETGRYGGKLESVVTFDLDRMELMQGALLTLHTETRYGKSVNEAAGSVLAVNDILFFPLTDRADEDILLAITEFRYTQFLSKELGFFAGKFVPLGGDLNEFAGGRGDTQFLSHSFLSASVTAMINPYSTLGGGVWYSPHADLTFQGNLYQTTDSSTTTGFDNFGDGWTTDFSMRTQYRWNELPGGARVAFEYAFDGDYVDFGRRFVDPDDSLSVPRTEETWVAYANAWQYLRVDEPGDGQIDLMNGRQDLRGIGIFARIGTADADVNPVARAISFGVGGKGVFGDRADDTFGIGYANTKLRDRRFISASSIDSSTNRLEAYYNFVLSPAVELTVDGQWTDTLLDEDDPAWLLGLRLRMSF